MEMVSTDIGNQCLSSVYILIRRSRLKVAMLYHLEDADEVARWVLGRRARYLKPPPRPPAMTRND